MPPIITTLSDLGIQKTTVTTFSRAMSHGSYSNGYRRLVGVGEGMTGQIGPPMARQRELRRLITPNISTVPTANELSVWLPWILSGTVTGTGGAGTPFVYQCTDAAVEVREINYRQYPTSVVEVVSNAAVNQATLSCDFNNPFLALNIDCLAKTMNKAGAWPGGTSTIETTTSPFILPDTAGAVSLAGTPLRVAGIAATFNFMIDPDRFLNTLDLTDHVKTDAVHTVALTFPYGERVTAYDFVPAPGSALIITWTNGTRIFKLTYPQVNFPEEPISRGLRTEVGITITGRAFRSSFVVDDCVTAELTIP
jgi:hypothetical protein